MRLVAVDGGHTPPDPGNVFAEPAARAGARWLAQPAGTWPRSASTPPLRWLLLQPEGAWSSDDVLDDASRRTSGRAASCPSRVHGISSAVAALLTGLTVVSLRCFEARATALRLALPDSVYCG
jgi:hypothetical protein